jgi:energy-coupling factor transporter ATP-binding protein EcfA2
MTIRIWISEIEFSDSSKIEFSRNDITVFVGPNNSGKSASLKESAALLHQKNNIGPVVKDITIAQSGEVKDLISLIESISRKHFTTNPGPSYQGFGYDIYGGLIDRYWSNYKNGLADLFPFFVNTLSTEDRLKAANPAVNVKLITQPPSHPIHFLQKHVALEKKFSDYFRQAFGMDLIVHRNAGSEVPLYIGEKPITQEGEDRISESYLNDLEKLDLLNMQGDGMRSFVGVLLNAFISYHSVIFIAEPEAFLHPPQARLLGKMIAKDMPSERQLFLATHSEDFLKGLLDADSPNLKIVRIQRDGKINRVSVLNNLDIRSVWSDSLLRHSNILNGLFHSKVIICESDSDCRFYSAIISAIYEDTGSISPDILFIHCGGKHRIPTVVKSLVKLNVIVRVIADFDVLSDINPLKEIYEEMGGVWTDIKSDWKIVKDAIDQKRPELETRELKKEIDMIFDSTTEQIIPQNNVSKIQKLLKKASAWAYAKEVGKSFVPSGDQTKAYERIQRKLQENGLYIVEVGQLESFVKSIGNHGPKWVNEVMAKNLKSDPELGTAKEFIQRVIN